MSIGPPALGNILVQRLDAVLGTSMAAYANLINGARADAVTPPGEAGKSSQPELDEHGQPIVDTPEGDPAKQIADAKAATALSLAARGLVTSTDFTPSAPTTLGQTARTVLALLAQSPDKAPPSQGQTPLWTAQPDAGKAASSTATYTAQAPLAGQAGNTADTAGQARVINTTPQAASQATAAQAATNQAAPQPAQFVQALRSALQQTGLFYESHLTQMVFGQRTPEQLAREPQARLDQSAVITRDTPQQTGTPSAQAPAQQAPSWGNAAGLTSSSNTPSSLLAPSGNSSTSLTLSSSLAADNSNPLAGIHPDSTMLVRQQLDVLANQALVWQGQAWPGVPMEWEVERDRSHEENEAAGNAHWATRLQIELPRLGLVQVRLNLSGNQLVLSLVAPSSAGELSQNSDTLRQRLAAAGLTLSQIDVNAQPPSPFDLE
jgi:hypothetical protein